ncbi:MAG: 2-phospho-L-lactate guanylyltransferase [Candidatus Acidiferrales bacterium]
MKAILIPVKRFCESKKRLGSHLSQSNRATLAEAMLCDFFQVVANVKEVTRIFVVSNERIALEKARAMGWTTLIEREQRSESDSVDAASRYCAARGVKALLRLPIDIPLAQAQDIDAIFAHMGTPPSAVIVPSRDGMGTNALLRQPPTAFPSRFGPNSFEKHLAEAQQRSVHVHVLRNTRIELDVDEMEDFIELRGRLQSHAETRRWISANLP